MYVRKKKIIIKKYIYLLYRPSLVFDVLIFMSFHIIFKKLEEKKKNVFKLV